MSTSPTKARSLVGTLLFLLALILRTDATAWSDTFPDISTVFELAMISRQIYHIASVDDINIPDNGMVAELFVESERGVEALVGTWNVEGREFVFVGLRGTDDDRDWSTNTKIALRHLGPDDHPVPSKRSSVRVHRGFNDACLAGDTYQQIEATVANLTAGVDDPTVYITGHSLGGVEALVVSSYMAYMHPDLRVQMISFGAPQLGNAAFKSWAENELDNLAAWRFVYKDDLVARALPLIPHTGHLMQMEDGGIRAYWRQDGGGEYAAAPSPWPFGVSTTDHKLSQYIGFLEKCIDHPDLYYPTDFERVHCTKEWWEFWKKC